MNEKISAKYQTNSNNQFNSSKRENRKFNFTDDGNSNKNHSKIKTNHSFNRKMEKFPKKNSKL